MTTGWRPRSWQLSAPQWDVLAELLRVESYPAPIQVRSHGRTDVERAQLKVRLLDELRQLGLLDAGGVEPDLAAALRVLNRPVSWVDSVWLPGPGAEQPVRVVVAACGAAGVCALQRPEQPGATRLEILPAGGLAAAVVRTLPPHPRGAGPAATAVVESDTAPRRADLVFPAPTSRDGAERSSAAVAAVLERAHLRAGQIAANMRDPSGRTRRSQILRWCDNPDGRYQVTITRPPGGQAWVAVAPADPRRLGEGVQRLLDSLRSR